MSIRDDFYAKLKAEQDGFTVTQADVFGYRKPGMVVAHEDEHCPIFGDVVPYKSITVVVPELMVHDRLVVEVEYWLDFVQGIGSVSQRRSMPDGTVGIRADYTAW